MRFLSAILYASFTDASQHYETQYHLLASLIIIIILWNENLIYMFTFAINSQSFETPCQDIVR